MESLRDWVLLLGGTALLSAVIGALAPPGAKQAFRVLCAVSVLYAVLLPLRGFSLASLDLEGLLQLLIGRVCCGALASLAEMFGEARLSVLYQTFAAGVRLLLVCSIYEGFLLLVSTGLTLQLRQ
ncbi:MAG: hypothetical protein II804_02525 [Clostridia bacterium]|nr:hypothetical protein [Clostridia bacterium]